MIQDKFQDWLVNVEGKKISTAQAYCSAINKLNEHYRDFEHKTIDLFQISEPQELASIADLYESTGKYSAIGSLGHRTYINAIKALIRFRNNIPKHRIGKTSIVSNRLKNTGKEITDEFNFDPVFKSEAAEMSKYYELFYCLERSVRSLIVELMEKQYGTDWWDKKVKYDIKENVKLNIQRESDTGYTKRSDNFIDYTTFGELRQIVRFNWEAFSNSFVSLNAFNSIMITLNTLRVPIAHCTPLADDEALRLNLAVKDWFRLLKK